MSSEETIELDDQVSESELVIDLVAFAVKKATERAYEQGFQDGLDHKGSPPRDLRLG